MTKSTLLIGCALLLTNVAYATVRPSPNYEEHNHGIVSYDVSMPIDATNYTLHGSHLTGGHVSFSNHGTYLTSLLAHETGEFKLPTVTNLKNKPLIKTHVKYEAIKFINPAGIDNIFIKIGFAARQQEMHGLDPFVIKNGSYTWQVPFFAFGKESNTVKHNSENIQFMQVGSLNDAADNNAMYTQDFYLYLEGKGKRAISGHPIRASRLKDILARSYSTHYQCHADGLWASGAPFRTVKGSCSMTSTTFPAGPDLDYETGRVDFPTVYLAGWKATPQDHAIINGKKWRG